MRNGQFEEYWVLLLITPGTFTGGPTDEVIAVESDTEAYHEWDSYRMFARSSSVSSTPRAAAVAATAEVQHFGDADPRIKVATIRQALRTFRFRLHFQGLLQELALYNQKFINQTSALKYDDLLRGLIQNVVGVQALTLKTATQGAAVERLRGEGHSSVARSRRTGGCYRPTDQNQ